jgi:hypothetical protein
MRPDAALARPARTARSVVNASSGRSLSLMRCGGASGQCQLHGRPSACSTFPSCFNRSQHTRLTKQHGGYTRACVCFLTSAAAGRLCLANSQGWCAPDERALSRFISCHSRRRCPLTRRTVVQATHPAANWPTHILARAHRDGALRGRPLAQLGHADGRRERGVDARVGGPLCWEGVPAGRARLLALCGPLVEAAQAEVVLAGRLPRDRRRRGWAGNPV